MWPLELGLGTHNPRFVAWPLELGLATHNRRFFAWPLVLGLGTHNPRFVAWPLELGLGTHNPPFFAWPLELGLGRPHLHLVRLLRRRPACHLCACPNQSLLPARSQVSPRQRPPGLSDLVRSKASESARRRGGTMPNGSFNRRAPAQTPPPPPQRGSFSRTSKQKSIHFFF